MTFILIFGFSGFTVSAATIYLYRRFKKAWTMPKGIYFKAGFALLVIELFHFSVLDSALSSWPYLGEVGIISQSLILGLLGGLFFELGRFFVLDKIVKVRSYKDAVYFGLGWNGVATFLMGVMIILGCYGLYLLVNTDDVSTLMPGADAAQIEVLNTYKIQTEMLINEAPLTALSPILERASLLMLDILMTLVIVLGFMRGTTGYVWVAVLGHAGYISFYYLLSQIHYLAGLAFLPAVLIGVWFVLKKMKFFMTLQSKT